MSSIIGISRSLFHGSVEKTSVGSRLFPSLSLRGAWKGGACPAKSHTEGSGERSRRISIPTTEFIKAIDTGI